MTATCAFVATDNETSAGGKSVQIFGRKLKAEREARFKGQQDTALAADMSVSNLRRIESNEIVAVNRVQVPKLAAALGMTVAEFNDRIVAPADPLPIRLPNKDELWNGAMEALRQIAAAEGMSLREAADELQSKLAAPPSGHGQRTAAQKRRKG